MDEYILVRNGLIKKDLIAFDGQIFQVLSLPEQSVIPIRKPLCAEEMDLAKMDASHRKIFIIPYS